jgi:hypothetical protein
MMIKEERKGSPAVSFSLITAMMKTRDNCRDQRDSRHRRILWAEHKNFKHSSAHKIEPAVDLSFNRWSHHKDKRKLDQR